MNFAPKFFIYLFASAAAMPCYSVKAQDFKTNWVASQTEMELFGEIVPISSGRWKAINIEPIERRGDSVLAWRLKPIQERSSAYVNENQSIGAYAGPGSASYAVTVGWERDYQITISNCPTIAVGKQTGLKAVMVGVSSNGIEVWDCGKVHLIPRRVPTADYLIKMENAREARKAEDLAATQKRTFDFWMDKATNGASYAQFEVGKLYLKGEGVEVDRAKGMEWIAKASANGDEDATAFLKSQQTNQQ